MVQEKEGFRLGRFWSDPIPEKSMLLCVLYFSYIFLPVVMCLFSLVLSLRI